MCIRDSLLSDQARALIHAGVARERICLDPGSGFGKEANEDIVIPVSYTHPGGQRQMLALGKLLLVHPRLLLLDEPTKGLDRAAREHVAGMIEAARRDGVTVIVSTHDLAFVGILYSE